MRKSIRTSTLPIVVAAISLVLVGCGSTKNTYRPPETNAGSVSLAYTSQSENSKAKRELQHALDLFENQHFLEAEHAFWALDKEYISDDFSWNIRVVSAALTCQLARGDIHRFKNDVQALRNYTSGIANLPRQTQVLLSMANIIDNNTPQAIAQDLNIDSRISDWFNTLGE